MIICSTTGATPDKLALDFFMNQEKRFMTYVYDSNIYVKESPSRDEIDAMITCHNPYVLSDKCVKQKMKIPGCYNPNYICTDESNLWVAVDKDGIVPLSFNYKDDVIYSTDKWKPKPKQPKLPALVNVSNTWQRMLLQIGTLSYDQPNGVWDKEDRIWRTRVNQMPITPVHYKNSLIISRLGTWKINEDCVVFNEEDYEDGVDSKVKVGRAESNLMRFFNETKSLVAKNQGIDLDMYDYYECEMQAVHVVISAMRILQQHKKKINEDNLTTLLSMVAYECDYSWDLYKDRLEDYMQQHIDTVVKIIG